MTLTSTPAAPASPSTTRSRPPLWSRILHAREFPVFAVFVAVLLVTSIINPRFLSGQARTDLMVSVAITGLMAVGQTFVIVMKHVDLSIGATLGMAGYVAAKVAGPGGSLITIVLVAAGVGIVIGVINGLLVASLRLPSLVVTLGTLYVVQGLLALVAGSKRINADDLPPAVIEFGEKSVLGIPYVMWVAIVAAVIGGWYLHSRRPGRDLYAVGSNPPASRLVGIPVFSREVLAFGVSGLCAGLAGVLFLARFGGVDANAGLGYELPVIAACVVGGVSIAGGSGTVLGAFIGALLLRAIGGSLSALSVPEFWQQAVNGTLLLLAITADRIASKRRERATAREVAS